MPTKSSYKGLLPTTQEHACCGSEANFLFISSHPGTSLRFILTEPRLHQATCYGTCTICGRVVAVATASARGRTKQPLSSQRSDLVTPDQGVPVCSC